MTRDTEPASLVHCKVFVVGADCSHNLGVVEGMAVGDTHYNLPVGLSIGSVLGVTTNHEGLTDILAEGIPEVEDLRILAVKEVVRILEEEALHSLVGAVGVHNFAVLGIRRRFALHHDTPAPERTTL